MTEQNKFPKIELQRRQLNHSGAQDNDFRERDSRLKYLDILNIMTDQGRPDYYEHHLKQSSEKLSPKCDYRFYQRSR
ncbi:MAG: hypothetical protein ACI9FB_002227 [Candidatus Azotimanducaceae bacterium]|jgi:hypothetical protein